MENFIIELLAKLDQQKTQKQLKADIKQLEGIVDKLKLTGTFAKGQTKQELNSYINQLCNQLNYVKLQAKIDNKNIQNEINQALNNVSYKDIDLDINENKLGLKTRKVMAGIKSQVQKTIPLNLDLRQQKLQNDLTAYLNKNTRIKESAVLLKESEKVRDLIDNINDRKTLREAADNFQLFK